MTRTRILHDPDHCYVRGQVLLERPESVLLRVNGRDVWLPKSQIEDPAEFPPFQYLDLIIPKWLAKKEGLV